MTILFNHALTRPGMNPQGRIAAAKLPGARFEVKNASDDEADFYLYGDIAWYDITAQMVASALADISAKTIRVHINSGGGDIFDGVAIFNLLKAKGKSSAIEVHIDGLAASIASVIAMAGDEIVIAKNAMMMIHRAWAIAIGDGDDMRAMATLLESTENDMIVPTYAARTGQSAADLMALMKAETWMNADTCVAKGFADKVEDIGGAKALVRPDLYAKMPRELVAAAEWKCGADRGLPIDKESAWDGDGAKERVLADAGFNGDNPDPAKARRAFLAYDASEPKNKGSYKLPFADIKDGKLTAVKAGVDNAGSRLPGTDIPEALKSECQAVIDAYQKKAGEGGKNAATLSLQMKRQRLLEASA